MNTNAGLRLIYFFLKMTARDLMNASLKAQKSSYMHPKLAENYRKSSVMILWPFPESAPN